MVEADAQNVVDLRNNPEVRQHMFTDSMMTVEGHLKWFHETRANRYDFVLETRGEQTFVGVFNFKVVGPETLEQGRAILPTFQGKGFAYEASSVLIHYLFTHHDHLQYISSWVKEDNLASIASNKKMNFVVSQDVVPAKDGQIKMLLQKKKFMELQRVPYEIIG
jgi:RimJ/RimL family protein N-acetyltransferase